MGLSSRADASGTTYVTRDNDGRVISERSGAGARRYYVFDGLGSTVSLTDANGIETSSYSFDPFGNRVGGAGGTEAMFEFAGGYRMANGLYHFGQRYYDPVTGRFTQQDPLDQIGDLRQGNRYLYAGCDPVNLTDLTGRRISTRSVSRGVQRCAAGAAAGGFVGRLTGIAGGGAGVVTGAVVGGVTGCLAGVLQNRGSSA